MAQTARPAICLNMIVRNEAHIVREALDSVAPFISSWVIVDTGSDDGTQDMIRNHMAGLGIPGQLYERRWRNFGYNRTEALSLAQGHGEYIWMLDADDKLVGTPELTGLTADLYSVRHRAGDLTFWRTYVFRNGVPVRFDGVTHETPTWDSSCVVERLEGEYHIEYRQLGSRSQHREKFLRDIELLLPEVERNPRDIRSIIFLAQSYLYAGDHANARKWHERRLELGYPGPTEEVYFAFYRIAVSMQELGEPWPEVQDAYLKAWEFRPTRAEPLYIIARHYRTGGRYPLGYLFARRAAEIPFPRDDTFVSADVYTWRAIDEQAICASWIGKHSEAFALCRRLIAVPEVPEHDRRRVAGNRDFSVPAMRDAAAEYPQQLVADLVAGSRTGEVTISLIAGPDRVATEQSLNTFLNCCADVSEAGRFLVFDAGLSDADRALLGECYGFVEFIDADFDAGPASSADGSQAERIRARIGTRFWLHLGQGWRFFAPEAYLTRLIAVLSAEPQAVAVGVNFGDADKLVGACAAEDAVRRTPDAGRYVLTDTLPSGPAMFDTTRLDRAGGPAGAGPGLRTATLDEVLCTAGG